MRKRYGNGQTGLTSVRRDGMFKPVKLHGKRRGIDGYQPTTGEARHGMKEKIIRRSSMQGQRSAKTTSRTRLHSNSGETTETINKNQGPHNVSGKVSSMQLHSRRGEEEMGINNNCSPDNGSEKLANKGIILKRERDRVQYRIEDTDHAVIGREGRSKPARFQRKRNGISGDDQYVIDEPSGSMKETNPKLLSVREQKSAKKTSIEGDKRISWAQLNSLSNINKRSSQTSRSISYNNTERPDQGLKKKKYAMRLDPYDISNKRLDDGMLANESMKTMKADLNKDAKLSMNAQFRAIRPSASILSFVEDNLLGRRRMIDLKRAGYNTELSAPLDNVSFSKSLQRDRVEESIFRNKLTFFAAAKVSSSFPAPDLPEIAFAGRSNVGKSSLLNALTRQWGIARISDKPGLTQSINFFKLGPKLCLVDLPGYGFAYAKEEVKEAWEELVKEYVSSRACLKQVCLLIDTKWGMKPRDHELVGLLERSHTKYQILLTKTDLVFPIDVARRTMQIEESHRANKFMVQPVMMVSSKSGAGIQVLRKAIDKLSRFAKF